MTSQPNSSNDPTLDDDRFPIEWDNGGSTTIPYGALQRGKTLRQCIVCEGVCEPETVRGMVCKSCRSRPVPGGPDADVIDLKVPEDLNS